MIVFSIEFWILLAVVCIIIDLFTNTFYLISIGVSSIITAIVNYYGYSLIAQLLIFIIVSILCILLSRPFAGSISKDIIQKSNVDGLIGVTAIVIEDINSNNVGRISVNNDIWLAISNQTIYKNEKVIIKDVSGVKLVVDKV